MRDAKPSSGVRRRNPGSRRRSLQLGVGLAALSLVAAACGGSGGSSSSASSSSKATVTFLNWADAESNTHPAIDKMITKFESLYPNITIKSQPVSYTNVEHQAILQVKSGNPPDVAEMQGNYVFDLASAGALAPLGSYATSSYQSSIIPRELNLGKINGQLDAVPWTVGPFGMWFNKTVMAKAGLNPADPPTTLDQLISDAATIKAKVPGVIPIGTDTTNRTYGLDQNWPFMQDYGATPFTGTKAQADTPAMVSYMSFMQQLGKQGLTQVNQKGGYFRTPASHNDVAFDIDGPYLEGVVTAATGESSTAFANDWGLTTIPMGPTGKSYSVPTDHQLVMFNASKNKQAAWTFMNWLSTSDYAIANYTIPAEESIPPLNSPGPAATSLLQSDPFYPIYTKTIIPTLIRPPWGPSYDNAYTPIMNAIQQVMGPSGSPSSVTSGLQGSLKSALAGT